MSAKDGGGPAFGHGDRVNGGDPGMSLRDYFAAQSLQLWHAAWPTASEAPEMAERAYMVADAMLAERAKGDA